MKTTDDFKKVIKKHLMSVCFKDPLFIKVYQKPGKNIDDCVTYILNTVKASGCNGFTDDEVFGMAMHYYDEDDIKVGTKVQATIITNHKVELSVEEIAAARQKAIDDVYKEQREKMTAKPKTTLTVVKDKVGNEPTTLF
jgi:hypothetical protein